MAADKNEKPKFLDRVAEEDGVAVVVLDENGNEVSASNNNSICKVLYSSDDVSPKCAQDCGRAFERAFAEKKPVDYECHAGLACRAVPVRDRGQNFVAIVGRTFVRFDRYKEATAKAISGEWNKFRPTEFFENVLMSGSKTPIENASRKLTKFTPPFDEETSQQPELVKHAEVPQERKTREPDFETITKLIEKFNRETSGTEEVKQMIRPSKSIGREELAELRAHLASLVSMEYPEVCSAVLEFVSKRFSQPSLIWLERRDDEFRGVAARGGLRGKLVRINMGPDKDKLLDHAIREVPLELCEKARGPRARPLRKLMLFPILIGDEIRAAIGVETGIPLVDPTEIARFAKTVGPQVEFVRMRTLAASRDWLAQSIRRFSESLKRVDTEDFWGNLMRVSAELLSAERASILVREEGSERLQPKAFLGTTIDLNAAEDIGSRVARHALDRGIPVVVGDPAEIGLGESPVERRYRGRSFISFPIAIGERRLAVINFTDRTSEERFAEKEIEFLHTVAPQIAVAIDRGRLKIRAGELEKRSITDSLTGLMNRGYIEERLIEEINQAQRHRFPMSLLMIDVDEFKSYNDTFGHIEGDAALRMVAAVLKETLRAADVAARYGGEEFAVLLPQTGPEEAAAIAERLRQRVERTAFPKRQVTISIGIAGYSSEFAEPKDWIDAADHALYRAKELGRNKVLNYGDLDRSFRENIH